MAKFNDEMIQQCSDWVRENGLMDYGGAKLKDFCEHFDIAAETYYKWMGKSEFSECYKKGKKMISRTVLNVVSYHLWLMLPWL